MQLFLVFICIIFSFVIKQVSLLSCYVCDIRSTLGYDGANKLCNTRGPVNCRSPQEKACMIETYRQGLVYQVVKTCLPQCPVFVNTSATKVRCCITDGCNDFITAPSGITPVRNEQGPNRHSLLHPRLRPPLYGRSGPPVNMMDVGLPRDLQSHDIRITGNITATTTTTTNIKLTTATSQNKDKPNGDNRKSYGTRKRIKDRTKTPSGGRGIHFSSEFTPLVLLLTIFH